MNREQKETKAADRYGFMGQSALLTILFLLSCSVLTGCQTIKPTNSALKDLQGGAIPKLDRISCYYTVDDEDGVWMLDRIREQSLPDASHVLSSNELPQEQAAAMRWMLLHLHGKYQIIERRFYLSSPGFTETSSVRSQAAAYVEQALGITPQPDEWSHGKYKFMMWALKDAPPRYFALVIDNEPPPQMEQRLMVGYFELVPAPVVSCAQSKCRTIRPPYGLLDRMRDRTTPASLDRISPQREQTRAKAAMARWMENHLKNEYRVIDQRFVLTAPGSTDGAAIGAKAHQYAEQTLDGVPQPAAWHDDEPFFSHHDVENGYQIMLWKLGDRSPRYIAMVMGSEFLPGNRKSRLVGYFELMPSQNTDADIPKRK